MKRYCARWLHAHAVRSPWPQRKWAHCPRVPTTFTALFPTRARFAGFAISYNVATALFGGTAALVSHLFVEVTGSLLVPAFYMTLACIVGLIAVYFIPETAGASLEGEELPGTLGTPVVAGTPAYNALENVKQPDQHGLSDAEMFEVVEEVNDVAAQDKLYGNKGMRTESWRILSCRFRIPWKIVAAPLQSIGG